MLWTMTVAVCLLQPQMSDVQDVHGRTKIAPSDIRDTRQSAGVWKAAAGAVL